MPSAKITITLAIIGLVGACLKLWLQHRAALELKAAEIAAREALQKEQATTQERAMRHAREAEERAHEREQKEKLISQLQESTKETLAILRNELAVRDAASARSFEYLDRNTRATEKLAETALAQAAELREIRAQVSEIKGGAGCRSIERRAA